MKSPSKDFRRQVETTFPEESHLGRYVIALDIIRKIARPDMKVADIASSGQMVPALRQIIGLTDITVTNSTPDGKQSHSELCLPLSKDGIMFTCPYDLFDIEQAFPYQDENFDLVILTEVLEHITRDPMHTLSEINRITKTGGWLLLETPNCSSLRSVLSALRGRHPQVWSQYSATGHRDRHNREYTPGEVSEVLESAGYRVAELLTADDSYHASHSGAAKTFAKWVANQGLSLLSVIAGRYVSPNLRGEAIYALAQKEGAVRKRFPDFLYSSH